jgi:hypothetical protein
MPVTLDRYVPNRGGILAILKSGEVTADLLQRGERVKTAALARGQEMETHHRGERGVRLQFRVISAPTRFRSRVRVIADHPGALNVERKHSILANALGAAG